MISNKKLQANRQNSSKGGIVTKEKFKKQYLQNPKYCKNCGDMLPQEKKYNKFCSSSCAATFNNKGNRKHGNEPGNCLVCGKPKESYKRKYCSTACYGEAKRFRTEKEIRARNAEISAAYRAKLKAQTPNDVDREAIKEFYRNCPEGYEVDHIIPISKNGTHSIENLQYLTVTENRQKGNKII